MAEPNALPTSAQPWMAGANAGPNVSAPMATPADAPEMSDNATAGLSGSAPSVGGSAQGPEEPHVSVSRHIMAALGGSDGRPMDWAKGILAGTLAAAGNVGKVPEGGGWLAGAAKGAQGIQQQKQLALENQQKQQEMDLKKKADARAEQELQIHMEDTKVQRAMWTAQTAASIQTQQQNAARFPTLEKKDQLDVQELQNKIHESERDQLAVLSAAGVNIADLEHITDSKDLTESHAKQAGAGDIFPVQNGEKHAAGEDGAGVHLVPGDVWEQPITKPVTITTGYEVGKDGKSTPKTVTAQPGTKVGTLLAIAKGAQTDLANKQKSIMDQATINQKNAEAFKAQEEGKKAASEAGAGTPQHDLLGGTFTPPAGGVKEANKIHDSFKKDADELAKTEGTYNQFQDVLNDINAGKDITGAQSVVALFNAIGISATPLKGMGMRINNNTVEEHATARGLGESVYQKFLKLKTGDVITPQQIKDYASIAMRSRRDAYVNKINEARAQGVSPDFLLPRGNGRHADANTAQIFYDTAAGNTPQEKSANAQRAAKAVGWQF